VRISEARIAELRAADLEREARRAEMRAAAWEPSRHAGARLGAGEKLLTAAEPAKLGEMQTQPRDSKKGGEPTRLVAGAVTLPTTTESTAARAPSAPAHDLGRAGDRLPEAERTEATDE
jgi:hypothetical protein